MCWANKRLWLIGHLIFTSVCKGGCLQILIFLQHLDSVPAVVSGNYLMFAAHTTLAYKYLHHFRAKNNWLKVDWGLCPTALQMFISSRNLCIPAQCTILQPTRQFCCVDEQTCRQPFDIPTELPAALRQKATTRGECLKIHSLQVSFVSWRWGTNTRKLELRWFHLPLANRAPSNVSDVEHGCVKWNCSLNVALTYNMSGSQVKMCLLWQQHHSSLDKDHHDFFLF